MVLFSVSRLKFVELAMTTRNMSPFFHEISQPRHFPIVSSISLSSTIRFVGVLIPIALDWRLPYHLIILAILT
jgi:hypothetical protein